MRFDKRSLERWVSRAFDRIARDPVRFAMYSVAAGVFVGGTIFSLVEADTSMPDGWWWAFVSMSTVGYGDISPATTGIRFLATFVIAAGILAAAIITAAIAGRISERRIAHLLETAHDTDELHDDVLACVHRLRSELNTLEGVAVLIRDREKDNNGGNA